ncbi:MAG: 50S ribosomal protein L34 [Actinobacteria bacterium]|nr:50S ribosomal protein L34 [Actinomycetota bacterium]
MTSRSRNGSRPGSGVVSAAAWCLCQLSPCFPIGWIRPWSQFRSLRRGSEVVVKRTYQPKKRRRARKHGFRHRMSTRAGRAIIKNRRRKGRQRLAA